LPLGLASPEATLPKANGRLLPPRGCMKEARIKNSLRRTLATKIPKFQISNKFLMDHVIERGYIKNNMKL